MQQKKQLGRKPNYLTLHCKRTTMKYKKLKNKKGNIFFIQNKFYQINNNNASSNQKNNFKWDEKLHHHLWIGLQNLILTILIITIIHDAFVCMFIPHNQLWLPKITSLLTLIK